MWRLSRFTRSLFRDDLCGDWLLHGGAHGIVTLLLATLEHRFTGHERHLRSESFIRSKEFLSNACPSEQIAYEN